MTVRQIKLCDFEYNDGKKCSTEFYNACAICNVDYCSSHFGSQTVRASITVTRNGNVANWVLGDSHVKICSNCADKIAEAIRLPTGGVCAPLSDITDAIDLTALIRGLLTAEILNRTEK